MPSLYPVHCWEPAPGLHFHATTARPSALSADGLDDIRNADAFAHRRDAIAKGLFPEAMPRLQQAQAFLWKVRFGLHVLTGRREDRLVFDVQTPIAETFGLRATGEGHISSITFRSGTIFKIAPNRQIFVFATLEASISAYHLAFGPSGDLFITGPTTSSFDSVYKIDPHGSVSTFYRGLGRPQGLAFDAAGNLYVAASLAGKRGIVKIAPDAKASLEVSGQNLVGLAFAPGRSVVLATTSGVHRLAWDIAGAALPPE